MQRNSFKCACEFAKHVGDNNPYHFPRVGMSDGVLYRGHWIVEHFVTGERAVICDPKRGALHSEADKCCFGYFDANAKPPEPPKD